MARCGCSGGTTCNCKVIQGANITVTGVGSSTNPYVVSGLSATVAPLDTPTVDMHVTGGPNYVVSADVIISPDAGNELVAHPNGLYAPAVCISTDAGNEIIFGTDGCLFAPTPTSTVFTNGPGIAPIVGNVIAACLSTDVGNSLVFGSDNCLFVAPGAVSCAAVAACFTTLDTNSVNLSPSGTLPLTADVIRDPEAGNILTIGAAGLDVNLNTGCGLTGDGTLASPLVIANAANVWPYACPQSNGGQLYCDPALGVLVSQPEKFALDERAQRTVVAGTVDINTLVPGPYPQPDQAFGPTFNLVITNPSPCLSMRISLTVGAEHFNMRMNNAGRGNVLVGARTGAAGAVAFPTTSSYHQQWMRDQNAAEADNTFDNPGESFRGIFIIPPGGVATFTTQADIQITNYDPGMVITLFDYILFMHAVGHNI